MFWVNRPLKPLLCLAGMSRASWCEIWSPTPSMNLPFAFTSTSCPAPGALWSIRPLSLKVGSNIDISFKKVLRCDFVTFYCHHSKHLKGHLVVLIVYFFSSIPPPSSHSAPFQCESDCNWRGHSAGFMETPRRTQRSCDTLHDPVRLQTRLDSWRMAGASKRR